MIRTIPLVLSATLLVIGCGSSSNNGDAGGNGGNGSDSSDMSAAMSGGGGGDLAMTLPPDMQPAYGCHALDGCLNACTDQASCGLCIQSATPAARKLYQQAQRCVTNLCYPHADAGPAPCTGGQGGGGTPSADCTACQDDSIKMSGTCGADTKYCGTCYTQYAACVADLP